MGDTMTPRCPDCGNRTYWIGGYWICRFLGCNRLVVR